MDRDALPKPANAVLSWLLKSIDIQKGQGSSAYYDLRKGWWPAYPETTGYILETLFDYAPLFPEKRLAHYATSCAAWLLNLQQTDGSFPGGTQGGNAIVFDTGQIVFGLTRMFLETGEEAYRKAAEKAVQWLGDCWQERGNWLTYSYVQGYEPSYNTRVIWAALYANTVLKDAKVAALMEKAFDHYTRRIQPDGWVRQWAFRDNEPALTHTIAYTLRGFLESAVLLNDEEKVAEILKLIKKVVKAQDRSGHWAGQYREGWQGDYRFICVTGHTQLCLLLLRAAAISGDPFLKAEGISLFQAIENSPWRWWSRGGVPGSDPIWGPYQRFRFPNWAAKFYLDAALAISAL